MLVNLKQVIYLTMIYSVTSAVNADESPWLLGVEAGKSIYGGSCAGTEFCQDEANVLGGYIGYQLSDYTRLKLGYSDFGVGSNDEQGASLINVKGVTYGFEGDVSLGDSAWKLGFEVGGMSYFIQHEQRLGSSLQYVSAHDFTPYVGVGLHYQYDENLRFSLAGRHFNNIVESDWDSIDTHISTLGLNVSYRFGSPRKNTIKSSPANTENSQVTSVKPLQKQDILVAELPAQRQNEAPKIAGAISYEVYFESGVASVTEMQLEQLSERLSMCENGVGKVELQGYADKTGHAEFNQWLSVARVESVVDERIGLGFKGAELHTSAYGDRFSSSENIEDRKVVVLASCL